MTKIRKSYDDTFKLKVVLSALKEDKTLAELASKFKIHPNQIRQWKKSFLDKSLSIFNGDKDNKKKVISLENEIESLHKCLGQKTMEVEFLKKNLKILEGM